MNLLIYGLGQGLDLIEKRIKREHNIVGYTDSYSALTIFRGKQFYKLEEICNVSFDYLVIAIKEKKTAWETFNLLIKRYGLSETRIIPFFVYANYEQHNWKLQNYNLQTIQGLIFGNSHARFGFLEEETRIPTMNLAVSGQDIYCNYRIFQKCISVAGRAKFQNLKYIIIDLYDYCYFNLDLSMCSYAIDYVLQGGCLDEHNFKNNPNYHKSFTEEMSDRFYIPEKGAGMEFLFDSISIDPENSYQWYHHIEKEGMLMQGPILGSAIAKRNRLTIEENIKLMELFLQEIYKFNSDIQIVFTLIPRYIAMERTVKPFIRKWEKEFNEIISQFCNKYNAVFLNYKERKEISENHMFYYDVAHLNIIGGRALTSVLNQDLERLKA